MANRICQVTVVRCCHFRFWVIFIICEAKDVAPPNIDEVGMDLSKRLGHVTEIIKKRNDEAKYA
jgi:hypothetical protein